MRATGSSLGAEQACFLRCRPRGRERRRGICGSLQGDLRTLITCMGDLVPHGLMQAVKAALAALGGASTTARSSRASLQARREYVKRRKFSRPVQLRDVEADWSAQGFHCGCMIDPPGHEWNNFTHDANELVVVVEGRMRFVLLDEAFELEPGDEIFIPAGVPHFTKNIAATNSKWFYGYDGAANSWF